MVEKIKSHSLGKLEIYIEPSHKVRQGERTLFRKIFPKSAYMHIITEAKKDGIINASAHSTHVGYRGNGEIQAFSVEGSNSKLTMCVELIDQKEKLQQFFLRHKDLLRSKVVIYKEVEFWDAD
jgi:PII-like signaling protein